MPQNESDRVPGITYDTQQRKVQIKVTDNGKGDLDIEENYVEGESTFKNTYNATGKATVEVKKSLPERAWRIDERFEFKLEPEGNAPMPLDEQNRPKTSVTTYATAEGVAAQFEQIPYAIADAGKTYTYTISEVVPENKNPGITYDETAHKVFVEVTDNGNGTLKADVKYGENANSATTDVPEFTNHYEAKTDYAFGGKKVIENREFNSNDKYTFELSADEGVPMPKQNRKVEIKDLTGSDPKTFEFGSIHYTLDDVKATETKPYEYTITESGTVGGVTNDAKIHKLFVTVTDNGDGTLTVTPTAYDGATEELLKKNDEGVVFTNTYNASATHKIDGVKIMKGRDFNQYDSYTFDIKADRADAPMPHDESNNVVTSITIQPREGKEQAFSFENIPFTLANKDTAYTYTITESGQVAGVTNDKRFTDRRITLMATDNGDGSMTVAETYDVRDPAINAKEEAFKFKNAYKATGEATLNVTKKLSGKQLEKDEFTFSLKRDDWAQAIVATNDADGKVTFPAQAFDQTDAGKSYHYTITEINNGKLGYTYDGTVHGAVISVTDNGDSTLKTEVVYDENKDATGVEFNNTYFKGTAKIPFDKYYYGAGDGQFTFRLTATNDKWEPRAAAQVEIDDKVIADNGQTGFTTTVTNGTIENGVAHVQLPELNYYKPGTYHYTLAEVSKTDTAVVTDAASYRITVEVGEDQKVKSTYTMVYGEEETPATSMAFYNNSLVSFGFRSMALVANSQADEVASVTPEVRKVLENGSLKGDDFTFTLSDSNGNLIQTATNDATGKIGFDRMTYSEPGVYEYVIAENAGNDATMLYDTNTIRYVVEVTKGLFTQALEVKETYYGTDGAVTTQPTFTNRLRTIRIRARKCSREPPYDPLVGSTYGIWMANPNGNDVYMGNDTSSDGATADEQGWLYYDVPTAQGYAYYLLEEAAPHGHLVDPYPTDYFTIAKGEKGYYLVYQNDPEFYELVPDLKGKI